VTVTVNAGVHYDERERVASCSTPEAPIEGAKEASTQFTLLGLAAEVDLPVAARARGEAPAPATAPTHRLLSLPPETAALIPRLSLPPGTALIRCEPLTGRGLHSSTFQLNLSRF
jgi:hypothetical protein